MKVYFNNSCKICKTEIDLYKKEKVDQIDWVDITNNQNAKLETNKNESVLNFLNYSPTSSSDSSTNFRK